MYHTDTTVKFVVTMMAETEEKGFHKRFKLESSLSLRRSNLVRVVKTLCESLFLLIRCCSIKTAVFISIAMNWKYCASSIP